MSIVFADREAAYPHKYKVIPADGSAEYFVVLERADEPLTPGTPLNAETFNNMVDDYEALHRENENAINAHKTDKANPHNVTAEQAGALPLKGGTMTGSIDMAGMMVGGLGEPLSDGDAVPLLYANNNYAPLEHAQDFENPHQVTTEQIGALPSSGGVLSGNLHFDMDSPRIHIAAGQTKLGIVAGQDDGNWYSSGASIFVYQNDNSGNQGFFVLNTGNIDGKQTSLYGNPNGDLTWGNNYVNPPMLLGVEYPTIERFNGKVVFAKVVDCGKLPAATEKSVAHGITDATTFLSVRVVAGYDGTHFEITKCEGDTVKISGSNIVIKTMWSAGSYQSYTFLKYVKD